MKSKEAIVLAGGLGTRLAHVLPDVCKPMAPVCGKPFLRYVLNQLSDFKFDRVVIADGYRKEQIESFFQDSYRGMEIVYSQENEPFLTGGAVKQALKFCESNQVFVLNGDTFFDIDFDTMLNAMTSSDADVIIAAKHMKNFSRYGSIEIDGDSKVLKFNEKHPCTAGYINGGIYLIRTNAFLNAPKKFSLEQDWFSKILQKGKIKAMLFDGDFIDIGIPEDYANAQKLLEPLSRKWKLAMFDRDGTVNVDVHYLHDPKDLIFIEGTIDLLRKYSEDANYKVVVITNQAGIARGLYTVKEMKFLHKHMDQRLSSLHCRVDAYYYCPHHPDFTGPCSCRKPNPGMLLKAMKDFDARPEECIYFGDNEIDMLAAQSANIDFVKV